MILGEKSLIRWYRGYLIVVYDVTRGVSRMGSNSKGGAMLSIYDIQNQFVGKSFVSIYV